MRGLEGTDRHTSVGGQGSDRTGSIEPFRAIELPDGTDPVEKGIIRRILAHEGTITVEVDPSGLGEELAERIVEQIRGAALSLDDAEHVRILASSRGRSMLDLPQVDHVVAVASAKGGVGKTTVAVGLARALQARGLDVGLFDADIYGPNVPHLLDVEGPILANEQGQPIPLDADGIQVLSPGVAAGEPPTARRGAIAYGAVENLLAQGAWAELDVLIVDMPAGSDDVVGAVLEYVPLDGAVFVTTPFDASVEDTGRTIRLFEEHGVSSIAGVVNMQHLVCACCGERNVLFRDDVSFDVPVLHELPFDHNLQRGTSATDAAQGMDAIATTVEGFLADLGDDLPDDAVDLRGLPPSSQARQLADELAIVDPGERVAALIDDPTWLEGALRSSAGNIVGDIETIQPGTSGVLLALTRAPERSSRA
ncbi:MAG: P-loop NTPase [Halobacteriota archaeon]